MNNNLKISIFVLVLTKPKKTQYIIEEEEMKSQPTNAMWLFEFIT